MAIEVRKIAGKKAAPEFNNFARVGHASLAEFSAPLQRLASGRVSSTGAGGKVCVSGFSAEYLVLGKKMGTRGGAGEALGKHGIFGKIHYGEGRIFGKIHNGGGRIFGKIHYGEGGWECALVAG